MASARPQDKTTILAKGVRRYMKATAKLKKAHQATLHAAQTNPAGPGYIKALEFLALAQEEHDKAEDFLSTLLTHLG